MIGFLFSPFGKIAIGIALALSLYFGLKPLHSRKMPVPLNAAF